MNQNVCPICATNAFTTDIGGGPKVKCPRCGEFKIGFAAQMQLSNWTVEQKANLSGWIREHLGCVLGEHELASLRSLRTPTVGEKGEKLLLHFAKKHPKLGEKIPTDLFVSLGQFVDVSDNRPTTSNSIPELLATTWTRDQHELLFLIDHYLIAERGLLSKTEEEYLRISPKGWAYLDSLRQENQLSHTGFIAMWFLPVGGPALRLVPVSKPRSSLQRFGCPG